jgi:hypothetical protein
MASSEAGFVPKPSLGPRANNVIIPLDLTQLSCPGFTLAAGLPSGFTTDGVSCWGGALWRACNLTQFSPCLTGPVDYLFASCHKGPRFKSPGGYSCETGILLLAMSRYRAFEVLKQDGQGCNELMGGASGRIPKTMTGRENLGNAVELKHGTEEDP